jgi:hypothetical protein
MFDPRTKLSEQVVAEVQRYFGDRVYDVIIPRTVRLSEAPGFGQPITVYDPKSKGAESYRQLAREVDEKPPPSAPMPTMDDLPNVVVAPPAPPEPLPAAEPAELEAMPTPAVHDLVEAPPEPTPTPAPAPKAVKAAPTPAPKAAAQPPPAPKAARKAAAAPKAATRSTVAAPPAPEAAGSPKQAPTDGEAAVWLEELTLEAERAAADTSSEVLARAAAEAEQNLEDDEVWDEEPADASGSPRPVPTTSSDRRVVVIDEDSVPVPEPAAASPQGEPQTGGARVGATLEDDPTRKKRWRLFRKGGE